MGTKQPSGTLNKLLAGKEGERGLAGEGKVATLSKNSKHPYPDIKAILLIALCYKTYAPVTARQFYSLKKKSDGNNLTSKLYTESDHIINRLTFSGSTHLNT